MRVPQAWHAFLFIALLVAPDAAAGSTAGPESEHRKSARFVARQAHLFNLTDADGHVSHARLVLDQKFDRLLSCVTSESAEANPGDRPVAKIGSPEGRYTCFEGREFLQRLAFAKKITPAWTLARHGESKRASPDSSSAPGSDNTAAGAAGPGKGSITKEIRLEDDDINQWWLHWMEGGEEELYFWYEFAAAGGGAQCMQSCNAALAATVRLCAYAPPAVWQACATGAAAFYVACIAGC